MAVWNVIDHTEVGTPTGSWTEGSIPASYDHLYLIASTRSTEPSNIPSLTLQVGNSGLDTGSNYSQTRMYASTSTISSNRHTSIDGGKYFRTAPNWTSNWTADTFGAMTVWIPNYANTSNYKQIFINASAPNMSTTDAQWELQLGAVMWQSTSAITDVGLDAGSYNFMQYSTFTLYGINGAG
jgi:hypothetical protein